MSKPSLTESKLFKLVFYLFVFSQVISTAQAQVRRELTEFNVAAGASAFFNIFDSAKSGSILNLAKGDYLINRVHGVVVF